MSDRGNFNNIIFSNTPPLSFSSSLCLCASVVQFSYFSSPCLHISMFPIRFSFFSSSLCLCASVVQFSYFSSPCLRDSVVQIFLLFPPHLLRVSALWLCDPLRDTVNRARGLDCQASVPLRMTCNFCLAECSFLF